MMSLKLQRTLNLISDNREYEDENEIISYQPQKSASGENDAHGRKQTNKLKACNCTTAHKSKDSKYRKIQKEMRRTLDKKTS